MRLGPWEIGLIVVLVLIVFGAGKLPEIGSAIGKGLRSFRQGQRDISLDEKPETSTTSANDSKDDKEKKKII